MKLLLTIDDRSQQVLYTDRGDRVPMLIKTVVTQDSNVPFHAGNGCIVQASAFANNEKSKIMLFFDCKRSELSLPNGEKVPASKEQLFMPNGEMLPVFVESHVFDAQSGFTVVEFICQATMTKNI